MIEYSLEFRKGWEGNEQPTELSVQSNQHSLDYAITYQFEAP